MITNTLPKAGGRADFENMLELTPVALAIIDIESGKPLLVNRRTYTLFGLTPDEVDIDVRKYYVDPSQRAEIIQRVQRDGEISNYELQMQTPERGPFWVQISGALIEFEGRPAHFVALHDITAVRKTEAALAVSEQRFKNVFDTTPHPMIITGVKDGLIKEMNRACIELFGVEDQLGQPLRSSDYYVNPADRERLLAELRKHGVVKNFEMKTRNDEGQVFDLLNHVTIFDFGDEQVLLSSFMDITEIKNLQRQLEQARKDAESASAAKTKFLASASHDLRQPMHAINLFMGLLKNEALDHKQRVLLNKIENSLAAQSSLLDALLDISKLDAEVVVPEKRAFRTQPLIGEVVAEYRALAEEKGLQLAYIGSDNCVESDPVLFESVLRNLISNAIRYTREGSVTVSATHPGSSRSVEISVTDTGIGIPLDEQQDIFREFYQVENPERDRSKGLGLGLAIVQRTLHLLGHELSVNSAPGAGSTFAVTLPLAQTSNVPTDLPSGDANAPIDLSDIVTYVIEDDADIREGMHETLSAWGCDAYIADSEAAALALLNQHLPRPQIVISDYRLPDNCNGVDAVKRLQHALNEEIPVIIITGDLTEESLRDATANGFTLVHKPVQAEHLKRAIRSLVDGYRHRAPATT